MPPEFLIRILPAASADLIAIHDFIETNSPQNATEIIRKLFDAIDSLEIFPQRYKIHRSNTRVNRVVHSMPVPPFLVFYRIFESDGIVEIMTVRHGARES